MSRHANAHLFEIRRSVIDEYYLEFNEIHVKVAWDK